MFLILVVITSSGLSPSLVSAEYYVNRPSYLWDYKNPPCKIATPDIKFTSAGPTVNIPFEVDDGSTNILVGYTKTLEVFEYVGCAWTGSLLNVRTHSVEALPGQCYAACKTLYFGLYGNTCFCLGESRLSILDQYTECNVKCAAEADYTTCGGYSWPSSYVTMYKRVETNEKPTDDGRYCRSYNQWTGSFQWHGCSTKLYGFCETRTSDFSYYFYGSWINYPRYCLRDNMYPATEDKGKVPSVYGGYYWIGRIKSWIIVRVEDASNDDIDLGYYGYIKKRGSGYDLLFSDQRSSPVLCEGDSTRQTSTTQMTPITTTTTTSTKTTTATTTTTVTTNAKQPSSTTQSTKLTTTPSSQGISTTNGTNRMRRKQDSEHNGDGSVPVAVFVVIALVLAIGAVVIILVILWRRKLSRERSAQKDSQSVEYSSGSTHHRTKTNGTTIQNQIYSSAFSPTPSRIGRNEIDDPEYANTVKAPGEKHRETQHVCKAESAMAADKGNENNANHGYFVQEKMTEHTTANDASETNDVDNTYDTTNASNTADTKTSDNVYNTFSEFADDTYSHVNNGEGNRLNTGQVVNNEYGYFPREAENVYNNTEQSLHTGRSATHADDTYSHMQ